MAENENVVAKKVVKREYYLLGVKTVASKEGKNAGKRFGIVDLMADVYYDDGTLGYSVENSFVDEETAKSFLQKRIPARTKVSLIFNTPESTFERVRIIDIQAI